MTSYNGQSITYDEIGNPLTYRDGMTMTWTGRQLTTLTQNGKQSTYKYDVDGLRLEKTAGGVTTQYQYVNGQLLGEKRSNGVVLRYTYDALGALSGIQYKNTAGVTTNYIVRCTLSGDVDQIYDTKGNLLARYIYDTWGSTLSVIDASGKAITDANHIANINPIRYRGYYFDAETGLYYVSSRYYDSKTYRWINTDCELSGVGGDILGYNLFAYCFNNPVNMNDPSGNWPKWLSGALNVVGGVLQVAAGAALGATVSWTGFGAAVAGFLIVNGTATTAQGVGQIVNHVTNSNVMREDNIIRTGVQKIGRAIGGNTGAKIAGGVYDIAAVAANLYAGKVELQQAGILPIKVNINNVVNNPLDEFVTIGPADGVIQQYCRTIPQSGYGRIYATQLGNGLYQIANGHHRVAALRALGYKTIKIFLTK